MRMFRRVWALVLLGGAAWAETEVDAYGLGYHDPNPQVWLKIDPELSVRARILHDKTGVLADEVTEPEVLRLEVAFTAVDGARDREVRFTCRVRFVDPGAEWSDAVADKPCYAGRLADGAGVFQLLDLDLRFRPQRSDPSGTAGVMVSVTEEVSGERKALVPTYRWKGGR